MGWFQSKNKPNNPEPIGPREIDDVVRISVHRIEDQVRRVAEMQPSLERLLTVGEQLRGAADVAATEQKVNDLKKQIADLEIARSKLTEEHERERRETLHMVGLEKKRQKFEVAAATREATLAVREENLAADQVRFREQIEFHEERFASEVGYLKDLMGQILGRLPDVNVRLGEREPRSMS